ncbi:hypothetical protein QYM36_016334 [Artemia franciscana]|uniref:Phage tail collar domain-containing protein n=1 Tax=Artemia franciscana TaxID=6661 RepID=A0AA88H6R7_ARTSF|nr:hypothetical protein QYM36_016334 [Artemia franciscana]
MVENSLEYSIMIAYIFFTDIDGGLSCSKEHGSIKDCSSSLPEVTHLIGVTDFVQNGPKFLSIGDLETYIEKSIRRFRTGQIFAFATDKKDPYLLPCNGESYYKADYPELYEALKNTIGTEVTEDYSKFRVPNMVNYPYLRAVARFDVGKKFEQSIESHKHNGNKYGIFAGDIYAHEKYPPDPELSPTIEKYNHWFKREVKRGFDIYSIRIPNLSVGGDETRPKSYGVYYAIHI